MTDYLAQAERLERAARVPVEGFHLMNEAAAALREARQLDEIARGQTETIAEQEDEIERLRALLEQTKHDVEIARIWGGQDWIWNSVPSFMAQRIWTRINAELGDRHD